MERAIGGLGPDPARARAARRADLCASAPTIADMTHGLPVTLDDLPADPGTEYRPGVCNIGTADIAVRRRSGHLAAAAAAGLLALLLATRAPRSARLLVAIPATASASGYIQALSHFCAGYGSAGVYNFGAVGNLESVDDGDARALDAARSRRIGIQSLGIGLAVSALAVAVPGRRRG